MEGSGGEYFSSQFLVPNPQCCKIVFKHRAIDIPPRTLGRGFLNASLGCAISI